MRPTTIAGADVTMTPPEGWDEARHGPCEDVQARRDVEAGTHSVGWKPDAEDLARLNAGAVVVMTAIGGLPPHHLDVEFVAELDERPNFGSPAPAEDLRTREQREADAAKAFEESAARQREIIEAHKRASVNGAVSDLFPAGRPVPVTEAPAVVIATDEPVHGEALAILRQQHERLRDGAKLAAEELASADTKAARAERKLHGANAQLRAIETAIAALGGKIEQ